MADMSNFKVIIVGGGIGGLALANSLQHAGVDYTLIERGDKLDPQQGASIGILPNGARILDQLGCYDELVDMTACMESTASHRADGSVIGNLSHALRLMRQRQVSTGYAVLFLDRQWLLRVLASRITDTTRVRLNMHVQSVEQSYGKVTVHCDDGTSIKGDIVVGADGVHSLIRRAMWQCADDAGQGEMFQQDKKAISAEYKCLFGISGSIAGMTPGQTDRTYAKGMSTLSYVGKEGRLFWFVFVKMDGVYHPPDIPKFTDGDAEELVREIGNLPIRENGKVTVQKLYDTRVACNLVAIEEAEYQHWSYGRLVCLGDSIHKMTPNLGAGASSAMESAAVLSNVLVRLASRNQTPTMPAIHKAFQDYQKSRSLRITRAMRFSNALTRVQALKGLKEYVYTHYIAPRADDSAAEMFSDFIIGAPLIEHLPVPPRSQRGTMPFNPKQGWGYEERKSPRALHALPLVVMSVLYLVLGLRADSASANASTRGGQSSGILTYQPANPLNEIMMYGIWLIESTRLVNKGSFAQFPLILGLAAQGLSVGVVSPVYLFLLYVQSPIGKFRASDNRLTDSAYTSTVGPLLLVLELLSRYGGAITPPGTTLSLSELVVKGKPFVVSFTQFLLARSVLRSTIQSDRLWAVKNDVRWVRRSMVLLLVSVAAMRIYSGLSHLLWYVDGGAGPAGLLSGALPLGEVLFAASVVSWLALVFRDFRKAGMTDISVGGAAMICATALFLLGPGFLLGASWLWREDTLINRRHKDALVDRKL